MDNEVAISSEVVSIGDAKFIRECVLPTIENVAPIATTKIDLSSFSGYWKSHLRAGPLTTTLIGFVIGVGSWLSIKVLDEIYSATLGKRVRNCIQRIGNPPEK